MIKSIKTLTAQDRHVCLGLVMTLNIDQDDYIAQADNTAGVRVSIVDQRLMPFPEDDGHTVGPGRTTSVGFTQVMEW